MTENLPAVKAEFQGTQVLTKKAYHHLVDDLKDIVVERLWNSRLEIMKAKWEIGNRICQEFEEGTKDEYVEVVKHLSFDLKVSESELYRCIEFKTKFPNFDTMLSTLPEGKSLSWNKIKTQYLPDLPFASIPLVIPRFEMEDTFGLTSWWRKNPDKNFILIVKDKTGLKLEVRLAKGDSVEVHPLKETFKELTEYFLELKKWKKEDLDSNDYGKFNRAIKQLLIKSHGDKEKIRKAMRYCSDKCGTQFNWTFDTVLKSYPEAQRAKPYEKYMTKKR